MSRETTQQHPASRVLSVKLNAGQGTGQTVESVPMPLPGFQPSDLVGTPVQTAQGPGIVRAVINTATRAAAAAATETAELLCAVELTKDAGYPATRSSAAPATSVVDESSSGNSSSTAATKVIHVTPDQMFGHSMCALGTPVLSVFGTGVLVAYRARDDAHVVRLWRPRGTGSALAYLRRESVLRPVPAAVGIRVKTPAGDGVVIGFDNGARGRQDDDNDDNDDVFMVRVDGSSKAVFVPGKRVSSPVAKVRGVFLFTLLLPFFAMCVSFVFVHISAGVVCSLVFSRRTHNAKCGIMQTRTSGARSRRWTCGTSCHCFSLYSVYIN